MISALSSSLAGLQTATNRIDRAAQAIANPQTSTDAAGNDVPQDPTNSLVDLIVGRNEFTANLKAIDVQNKTEQSLLDILA